MRETQPAAYLKILALLVPREHKVEHTNAISSLSDEELDAAIEHIKAKLAARAGETAKMIEGEAVENKVAATTTPLLVPEAPKCRSNRLMMEADTAIGPRERKPRKRKLPLPPGA